MISKKDHILSYLASKQTSICDDCLTYPTHCSSRQEVNQNCRKLSEKNMISRYSGVCSECKRSKIVNMSGTKPSVQHSPPSPPPSKEDMFLVSKIEYTWNSILSDGSKPYMFPHDITAFMKSTYRIPTIYRWVMQNTDGNIFYYIGETEELCPRRLNQYLKPGPTQQTNQRLNEKFQEMAHLGYTITLDILTFKSFTLNSTEITLKSLHNSNLRKMIEHLIIYHYQSVGISLLNR